jgi:hypothetical protein
MVSITVCDGVGPELEPVGKWYTGPVRPENRPVGIISQPAKFRQIPAKKWQTFKTIFREKMTPNMKLFVSACVRLNTVSLFKKISRLK